MDKPLSQIEAYRVADWLQQKGRDVGAALRTLWRKRPSEVAKKYQVEQAEIAKAAGREAKS